MAVVLAVTVGAVQLNVQLWLLLPLLWTNSLLRTLVPVPAVNVPAVLTAGSGKGQHVSGSGIHGGGQSHGDCGRRA